MTELSQKLPTHAAGLLKDVNSNTIGTRLPDCIIDLTIEEPFYDRAQETIVIEDDLETVAKNQYCTDISSRNFQNYKSAVTVKSIKEGELSQGKLRSDSELEKTKNCKRKSSSVIVENSNKEKKNKTNKIDKIIVTVSPNSEQLQNSNSAMRKVTYRNEKVEVKSNNCKTHRRKKLGDVTIKEVPKASIKHASSEKKSRQKKDAKDKSCHHNRLQAIENSSNYSHRKAPYCTQVKEDTKSAVTGISTPLRNLQSNDRPIPQCLRHCSRASRDYVPKWSSFMQSNAKITVSTPALDDVSSDELILSENEIDSSFSLSDIDTLISRTKTRELNQHETQLQKERNIAEGSLQNEKEEGNKISEFNAEWPALSESVLKEIDNFDITILEHNHAEPTKDNEGSGLLQVRLVPIKKLLKPLCEVSPNEDLSSYLKGKTSDIHAISKIKPVGTVKPMCIVKKKPKKKERKLISEKGKCLGTKSVMSSNLFLKNIATKRKEIEPQAMNVEVGSVLNELYETCEIVRRGSYSNIVRAVNKFSGKKMILKILHIKKYSHMLLNLERVHFGDPMDRYHCVRLNGSFSVGSHLALWLEDCRWNLKQFLEVSGSGKGLPITTVRQLGRQLLVAVQFLRECCILHTNIRPEHILIKSDNLLKLTGFDGAAGKNDKVQASSERGPLVYQAPENILNEKVSYAVDVWSAACVIYEMATGRKLFNGETAKEILMQMFRLGDFPKSMKIGKYFPNGICVRTNDQSEYKRNLKDELFVANLASNETEESESSRVLVNLLSMALRAMLLLEPTRRISVDFALLNRFFNVNL